MNKPSYNTFDLSQYETVKQRKTRLRNDYPDSVIYPIQVSAVSYAKDYVVYIALVWKDKSTRNVSPEAIHSISSLTANITPENAAIVAASIGLVLNADSTGHSLSIAGGIKADKNAWVENCEESAVGRALDNLGYHSGSCSQEEIKKVISNENTQKERVRLENEINALLGKKDNQERMSELYQLCIKSTKPFKNFSELSISELEIVLDIVSGNKQTAF